MEVVSRVWKSVRIEERIDDGYFNATAMCRACGSKPLAEYLRSARFTNYGAALAKHLGLNDKEDLVHVKEAGTKSGTWVHPRIAIDLARWLCVEFAVHMDAWYLEQIAQKNSSSAASPQSATPQPRAVLQVQLMNETDLHHRVVRYIRRFHPSAVFVAGLGELQDTEEKRLDAWAKGYLKGQPDLLILNRHRRHSGLALELKTPAVTLPQASQAQLLVLEKLQKLGFQTLVSNDYDVICRALDAYMGSQAFHCACCGALFKSENAMEAHHLRKRLRDLDAEEDNSEETGGI